MARMARLDRLLTLVGVLNDSAEGMTLDEMAEAIGTDRRTAERLRDVIRLHFELEEELVDRRKRFRIRGTLRRVYTRPNAAELAALQTAADGAQREGAAHAQLLETLGTKVRAALDDRERRRLDPDLEPLARLQRQFVPAGPLATGDPAALAQVQGAIMAGQCLEFDYLREGWEEPRWRRVVPVGLLHGAVTYLIGQMPVRGDEPVRPPVPYRLDRMSNVRSSNTAGCPAPEWDIDSWLAGSFGLWREEGHDVVLRVAPAAVARARAWRFHPGQELEEDGEELLVRFHAGGLREIADHLFTWGGEVRIEGPEELRAVMRERLAAAGAAL